MKGHGEALLAEAGDLLHVAEDERAFGDEQVLAVLAINGVRHHDLQWSGKLPIKPIDQHRVDGCALKDDEGLAVRGVHVYLLRTFLVSCSGGWLRSRRLRQACGASWSIVAGAGLFRRWARSAIIGGDKIGGKASFECQSLFRICDGIAGRLRGLGRHRRRQLRSRSRNAWLCGIHRSRPACRRYRCTRSLCRGLLLALALVRAQVLLQLLNLPLVRVRRGCRR